MDKQFCVGGGGWWGADQRKDKEARGGGYFSLCWKNQRNNETKLKRLGKTFYGSLYGVFSFSLLGFHAVSVFPETL
jgi:hypothetical protein